MCVFVRACVRACRRAHIGSSSHYKYTAGCGHPHRTLKSFAVKFSISSLYFLSDLNQLSFGTPSVSPLFHRFLFCFFYSGHSNYNWFFSAISMISLVFFGFLINDYSFYVNLDRQIFVNRWILLFFLFNKFVPELV